jgi:hypothetical protein
MYVGFRSVGEGGSDVAVEAKANALAFFSPQRRILIRAPRSDVLTPVYRVSAQNQVDRRGGRVLQACKRV